LKIAICINTAWNIVNFRAGLIAALRRNGHEVIAIAPPDAHAQALAALVDRYIPLEMDNRGTSPVRDALLFFRFVRLLRALRPDAFLGYTIKPNVYGSLAARLLGIAVVNNVSGLGATFIRAGFLNAVVRRLYTLAFKRSHRVFFQNQDDRDLFVSGGLVASRLTQLLPGSGIDLQRFRPLPPPENRRFRFLLTARLLWDKGVGEYVDAARQLKTRFPDTEFCLLGFCDVKNPAAISREQVRAWEEEGVIRYLGETDQVIDEIAKADCVVLPSYREGMPRSLLEAAACARPVIATDVPGCREVVEPGRTGLLCQVKRAADLALKMEQMLRLSPQERDRMGACGRQRAEQKFDEKIVIGRYLDVLAEIEKNAAQNLSRRV
jgi:glycosyltransferase involved in cell wall biosynthesis